MTAVQFGHDADVGDAQVGGAAHAELSVDDGEGVVGLAHAAGAGGMVACCERIFRYGGGISERGGGEMGKGLHVIAFSFTKASQCSRVL